MMKEKSLRQLAKELGVSASYLSQIRHGKKRPSQKVLTKIMTSVNQNGCVDFASKIKMAGELGFEPSLADPESAVLPLDDSPAANCEFIIHCNLPQDSRSGERRFACPLSPPG